MIQREIIKSVMESDEDILNAISRLYLNENSFELDPCYSKGLFYGKMERPKYKFDKYPQNKDVIENDLLNGLPFEDKTINSIVFDPPFIIGVVDNNLEKQNNQKIYKRFSGFRTKKDLEVMYIKSLEEFSRILKNGGIVAFKCQDTVTSGKQFITHNFVINEAEKLGFIVEDIFIKISKVRMISPLWKNGQKHSRKFHSYWIVLRLINHS